VPEEAESIRKKFRVDQVEGYIHVGLFENGDPGEIFVNITKAKPTISGLIDQWAIALSIGLQYGVPLEKYVEKFKNVSFKPAGFTGGDEVCKVAQSVVDYVARYLEHRFLNEPEMVEGGIAQAVSDYMSRRDGKQETTGTPCPECGTAMIQNGTCEVCPQCGETTGCG
jgi:ribonucleoside-diphosphate reductase alpha chain